MGCTVMGVVEKPLADHKAPRAGVQQTCPMAEVREQVACWASIGSNDWYRWGVWEDDGTEAGLLHAQT
jgi:hypothetical protein